MFYRLIPPFKLLNGDRTSVSMIRKFWGALSLFGGNLSDIVLFIDICMQMNAAANFPTVFRIKVCSF